MPRVLTRDEGLPVYRVTCDQCGLAGQQEDGVASSTVGFHQPAHTTDIFLCETCFHMDLGQEDWLVRFAPESWDQRTHMLRLIEALRADPHVASVEHAQPSQEMGPRRRHVGDQLAIIRFVTGARRPQNNELAERVEARRTFRYGLRESSALVEDLMETYHQAVGHNETNFAPGTMSRTIVESVASVIEEVEGRSLEQCRDVILTQLSATLGPQANLTSESSLRTLVDEMTEQAYEGLQTQNRQQQIIQQLAERLDTPEGRTQLSMAMYAPIARRRNLSRLSREFMPIQQLPAGAVPIYNRYEDREPASSGVAAAPLPAWCRVNGWVKRQSDGIVARVIEIKQGQVVLKANAEPPPWDGRLVWDRLIHAKRVAGKPPPRITDPVAFESDWEPAEDPAPPKSVWERIVEGVL